MQSRRVPKARENAVNGRMARSASPCSCKSLPGAYTSLGIPSLQLGEHSVALLVPWRCSLAPRTLIATGAERALTSLSFQQAGLKGRQALLVAKGECVKLSLDEVKASLEVKADHSFVRSRLLGADMDGGRGGPRDFSLAV